MVAFMAGPIAITVKILIPESNNNVQIYNGTGLPAQYNGGAFVSNHGSWDRSPLSGYDVVFIPFKDGMPSGKAIPIVTGFHSKDESKLFGAPVGLTQDRNGALLVADDVGNIIWRVSAQ